MTKIQGQLLGRLNKIQSLNALGIHRNLPKDSEEMIKKIRFLKKKVPPSASIQEAKSLPSPNSLLEAKLLG